MIRLGHIRCPLFLCIVLARGRVQIRVNGMMQPLRRTRPLDCERCGRRCGDRHHGIWGHHDDYSRPRDVVWLCGSCHKTVHREMAASGVDAWRNCWDEVAALVPVIAREMASYRPSHRLFPPLAA